MEMAVDIAIRIENVFGETLNATVADAVELRANQAALVFDLMAGCAVGLKNMPPLFCVKRLKFFGGVVFRNPLIDELFQLFVLGTIEDLRHGCLGVL